MYDLAFPVRPGAFIVDVGCGDRKVEGAFGVDEREIAGVVDLVADAATLRVEQLPRPADLLVARHVLEHFSWRCTADILAGWRDCLVPGGVLYVEVPRMDYVAKYWQRGDLQLQRELIDMAYGGQDYPGNFHHTLFSPELLVAELERAGLVDIQVVLCDKVVTAWGTKP